MAKRLVRLLMLLLCVWTATASADMAVALRMRHHLQVECMHVLQFGGHVAGGSLVITVNPNDAGALVCRVSGNANARFKLILQGNQVVMHRERRGKPISVRDFRYGGALSPIGLGRLNGRGELGNCRIGATASVSRKNRPGLYRGKGTVRIIYL